MKSLKISSLKTMLYIVFISVLLPGCAQPSHTTEAQSGVDKPKMDIQAAILTDNLEVVKQHIAAGTDINKKEPLSGSSPLVTAATFGKTEIAKALIDAGADLSVTNNEGATALHAAAFFCRVEIVQMLIDAKANKTLRNNFGATPRESVIAPFADVKPIYQMIAQQLSPMGLQLDLEKLEETRPVIAMMLQ
ncbi:MAG: ankyrin repeat domain-containing protein [Saprospiraceae bacterium]|nr:ankyrin repeat domain-containing protein [Lewinella sp.]